MHMTLSEFSFFKMKAHKFVGSSNPNARSYVEAIHLTKSPEEAARMGRKIQREHPDMVWFLHAS